MLNAEMRYPIVKMLQGVIFFDGGYAWESPSDIDPSDLRYSAGVGLRVDLPIGAMIRLDYGYAINPRDEDDLEPFSFSFGQSF